MKQWEKFQSWRHQRQYDRGFKKAGIDAYNYPDPRSQPPYESFIIRGLDDDMLAYWLSRDPKGEAKIQLEREFRRREAWAAPAGRAFWLSVASFSIAVGALLLGLYNAFK